MAWEPLAKRAGGFPLQILHHYKKNIYIYIKVSYKGDGRFQEHLRFDRYVGRAAEALVVNAGPSSNGPLISLPGPAGIFT